MGAAAMAGERPGRRRSASPGGVRPGRREPRALPPALSFSNEGTCYRAGEYCRDYDHGMTGVAGYGEAIVCEDNDGWRWESPGDAGYQAPLATVPTTPSATAQISTTPTAPPDQSAKPVPRLPQPVRCRVPRRRQADRVCPKVSADSGTGEVGAVVVIDVLG
jgi:hypothetical protein